MPNRYSSYTMILNIEFKYYNRYDTIYDLLNVEVPTTLDNLYTYIAQWLPSFPLFFETVF